MRQPLANSKPCCSLYMGGVGRVLAEDMCACRAGAWTSSRSAPRCRRRCAILRSPSLAPVETRRRRKARRPRAPGVGLASARRTCGPLCRRALFVGSERRLG
jgi:hypothetical protein